MQVFSLFFTVKNEFGTILDNRKVVSEFMVNEQKLKKQTLWKKFIW